MYVTLEQAKKHLNIDNDFNEDDDYIKQLIQVAEIAVEKHIDCDLKTYLDKNGSLEFPLIQTMLLFVGNMYANRESVSITQQYELPLAYCYILDLYKDYKSKDDLGGIF